MIDPNEGDSEEVVERRQPAPGIAYRRVMLKLSGESLCKPGESGIDVEAVQRTASIAQSVHDRGVETAIVIGGGNIMRGSSLAPLGINRATADYMGMLATAINAMALQDALEKRGVETRICSGLDIQQVAERFIRRRAVRHLEKGRVVILSCGSGAPYFTTDTAAALRAVELGAEVLMKATKVDGVYDKDPKTHADAERIERLTYMEVMNMGLGVMDKTAITLCMENQLPIVVFDMANPATMESILRGKGGGTIIS